MITNSGLIEDYTNDGEKNRTFPHLKQTYYEDFFPGAFKSMPYDIFGVYHNNFLHFLSCDTEKSVKIYHIDNHRMESIPDSKIPNVHLLNVKGLQVGKYFWIYGLSNSKVTKAVLKNLFDTLQLQELCLR